MDAPARSYSKPVLSEALGVFLQHLASSIVPEAVELTYAQRKRLRLIVRFMLCRRSGMERVQVRVFLFLIGWLPALVFLRPFERIPEGVQDWILRRLEAARIRLVRAGFWGLKTLIFMGYFGQHDIVRAIGYTPSLHDGNVYLESAKSSA